MVNQPTADVLYHVTYEIRMLNQSEDLLRRTPMLDVTNNLFSVEELVGLEAFAMHARVLIEYLHFGKHAKYVRAVDLISNWHCSMTKTLTDALARASSDTVHIEPERIRGENWRWHTRAILRDLNKAIGAFLGQLSPGNLAKVEDHFAESGFDWHLSIATASAQDEQEGLD